MTAPAVHVLDPLSDSRWDEFLERHPRASVFHSRGWLEALKRTYGYEPIVLTTTAQGPLENGLALCRVSTWTSRRAGVAPLLGSLRAAGRSARRPVRDAGVSGGGDGEGALAFARIAASARRHRTGLAEGRQLSACTRWISRGPASRSSTASTLQHAARHPPGRARGPELRGRTFRVAVVELLPAAEADAPPARTAAAAAGLVHGTWSPAWVTA